MNEGLKEHKSDVDNNSERGVSGTDNGKTGGTARPLFSAWLKMNRKSLARRVDADHHGKGVREEREV